jgi:hypothetical protein
MKTPQDLSHDQLVQIVRLIQDFLYQDPETGQFDCDREWNAADVCQAIATSLEEYDLLPDSRCESRE